MSSALSAPLHGVDCTVAQAEAGEREAFAAIDSPHGFARLRCHFELPIPLAWGAKTWRFRTAWQRQNRRQQGMHPLQKCERHRSVGPTNVTFSIALARAPAPSNFSASSINRRLSVSDAIFFSRVLEAR